VVNIELRTALIAVLFLLLPFRDERKIITKQRYVFKLLRACCPLFYCVSRLGQRRNDQTKQRDETVYTASGINRPGLSVNNSKVKFTALKDLVLIS
jgi:hypothetical protein